ncbi:hypothetical protein SAMN05880566_12313 [Janthinobacterium sp. TND4EL3]|nr:hypothetical protein SAMN05880566_12313 [Janthinobacterium sp. TND4EL3]
MKVTCMAYAAVDLKEYRNALESQFGAQKAGTHTLIHIDQITGPDGVGVAYNLADATMWVLIDDTARMHDPKWKALFLAETATALTNFFRTLVAPAQNSSDAKTHWGGRQRGPFVVYKFALLDKPEKLAY